MAENLLEIRWHARGGQGAKTAATLVAEVAIEEGKHSQGFPEYGPERMGAPIRGYTRISDQPITLHCAIGSPDVVVVLDPTLLETVDVADGVPADGAILVNTPMSPVELRAKTGIEGRKLYTVDATQIAIDEIGRPIPNTPMIGALIKATAAVSLETVEHDVEKKFMKKFGHKVVQGNINSVNRAYEEVKSE